MVSHSVVAPDWLSAYGLVRAVERRGGFARKVVRNGLNVVFTSAAPGVFEAACKAEQFRPGLATGYNPGRGKVQ